MGCSSSKELHQTGAVPPAPVEPKEATVNKAATVNEHVPPVLEQKTSVVLPPKEPLPPYLLHIAVSPMGEESHSRSVAADFLSAFQEKHKGMIVVTRDLAAEPVDHIEDDTINVEFVEERARTPRMRDLRDKRMDLIQEIMEADAILVSTPMYNWCVPSTLKAYIDHLVLPGVLDPVVKGACVVFIVIAFIFIVFSLGLADRPVTCIIAYGGTYAPGSFNPHFDYATGE